MMKLITIQAAFSVSLSVTISMVLITGSCCFHNDNMTSSPVNKTDIYFMENACYNYNAVADAGQLATMKATNEKVREFGAMVARDHHVAYNQLQNLAAQLKVTLPSGQHPVYQNQKAQLSETAGAAFDSIYIHSQITDHEKAMAIFEIQAENGSTPELVEYAERSLPKFRARLQYAQSLALHY